MPNDKTLLTPDEVKRFLEQNPGWRVESGELVKTFEFGSFREAIAFVTRVAEAAERLDHHPAIDIRYRKVTLRLSTHSAGGLTFRDPQMAREAEQVHAAP